jgi:alditol oxidase
MPNRRKKVSADSSTTNFPGVVARTEQNWAGNLTYRARRIINAGSIGEVQESVAQAQRVRPLGTRHAFNDIADSPDTLVSVVNIGPDPQLDQTHRTLTIGAGSRYDVVARFAEQHGWALHNMGSLPHISIGGAISTGTHGSGNNNGGLATAVSALQFVSATGELVDVRRGDATFAAMVVGLGAFGVLVRVTLDLQPTYSVRQDAYRSLAWDALLDDVDGVMGAAYSVSIFTDWCGPTIDQIWLKSRIDANPVVLDEFHGAQRDTSEYPTLGESISGNFTRQGGIPGPWLERLPHFRIDATPSNGDEIQSEYFVKRAHAPHALAALRTLGALMAPQLIVSELRTVAADDLWLSPAYHQDVLAIHFTWKNDSTALEALLPEVERALAPFDPRPHWGKVHGVSATALNEQYSRLPDFRMLADGFDPSHKFRNEALDRYVFAGHVAD